MATIHPTSTVASSAQLGANVDIGPYCYVGENVTLGDGCRLVSHVCVMGPTVIGHDNTLWPHAAIGADPQDLKHKGEPTRLVIGDNNQIRENVTIHRGTVPGGGVTTIGSNNLFMVGCHIAHDCHLGDNIRLANNVLLAGHIKIEDNVIMLGAAASHHFVTIGKFAYVSGMTRLKHDVPPYMIVEGYHARVRALNSIGLERGGLDPASIERLKDAFRWIYRVNRSNVDETGVATISDALDTVDNLYGDDPHVKHLTDSILRSTRGRAGRAMEAAH